MQEELDRISAESISKVRVYSVRHCQSIDIYTHCNKFFLDFYYWNICMKYSIYIAAVWLEIVFRVVH